MTGDFSRGDAVIIRGAGAPRSGAASSRSTSTRRAKIVGKRSGDIEALLGYRGRSEMIHRDDMVLRDG